MADTLPTTAVLFDRTALDDVRWDALPAIGEGASHKVLWRSGDSIAGLMKLAEGGCIEPHSHRRAHHHLWVVDGSIDVLDTRLDSGSYAHVPAGTAHGILNLGAAATFFYLYLQPD
jgi:quercetin dioxygenase-like cupin family protein